MGVKYEIASPQVQKLCGEILKEYHPELVEFEVSVVCVFASQEDESKKPSVKLHGRPCYATVRKTAAFHRALGIPDAVITIDRRSFKELGEEARKALLDHELSHLAIEGGADSSGRPKLTMKHHDWELHGFRAVVERWGVNAIELNQLNEFTQAPDGQVVFNFLEEIEDHLPDAIEHNGNTIDIEAELVKQAVEVIRQRGRASTSSIQRNLRIGYNRAARVMDMLEERGIVGPPSGEGPREILKTPEELLMIVEGAA